jgi:hypothetical protein
MHFSFLPCVRDLRTPNNENYITLMYVGESLFFKGPATFIRTSGGGDQPESVLKKLGFMPFKTNFIDRPKAFRIKNMFVPVIFSLDIFPSVFCFNFLKKFIWGRGRRLDHPLPLGPHDCGMSKHL